jgi:hypothetical protein
MSSTAITCSLIDRSQDTLAFTIQGIALPFANAIRRTLMSDIPVLGFYTEKHALNKCTIAVNTLRTHNEIVKHRLSCIPVHYNLLQATQDEVAHICKHFTVHADSDGYVAAAAPSTEKEVPVMRYMTPSQFQVKTTTVAAAAPTEPANTTIPSEAAMAIQGDDAFWTQTFFPKEHSHQQIAFARILPGERLAFSATLDVCTPSLCPVYNACVHTLKMVPTRDKRKSDEAWTSIESFVDKTQFTEEELRIKKNDFYALDAFRYVYPESFDFSVESVGVYDPVHMVRYALMLLQEKCKRFQVAVKDHAEELLSIHVSSSVPGTQESPIYDIRLHHEDQTIGNILAYLFQQSYMAPLTAVAPAAPAAAPATAPAAAPAFHLTFPVSFVAFDKLRPHASFSVLRVGLLPANFGTLSDAPLENIPFLERLLVETFSRMQDWFTNIDTSLHTVLHPLLQYNNASPYILHNTTVCEKEGI